MSTFQPGGGRAATVPTRDEAGARPGAFGALRRLGAALRARVHRGLAGEAEVSPLPAQPVAGPLGPPVLRLPRQPVGPRVAAPTWGTPETEAQLREDHRHGWFAALASHAAAGDTAARDAAIAGLAAWLRYDRPGSGPAWDHPSDLTARLAHWAAGLAWLGDAVPAELVAEAAGSAHWHLRHLRARLPLGPDDAHRRVVHHAGIVLGALTFPALPDARQAWSEAVPALAAEMQACCFADGSDRAGAPRFLEQSAWCYALAFAAARANGVALPAAGNAAWTQAVRYLDRLAGDGGRVPPLGESPFGVVLHAPGSLPGTLRTLAVAWGLDPGEPGPADDARAAWFGAAGAASAPPTRTWSVWSFAEDGTAIASYPVRDELLRVVLACGARSGGPLAHDAPLQLLVDLGETPLLADPGPGVPARGAHGGLGIRGRPAGRGGLRVARADGRKATLEGDAPLGNGARWERRVRLEQQRLRVYDRLHHAGGPVALCWTIGEAWQLAGGDTSWTLRRGAVEVKVELPGALRWRAEATGGVSVLHGEGDLPAGAEVVSGFELR